MTSRWSSSHGGAAGSRVGANKWPIYIIRLKPGTLGHLFAPTQDNHNLNSKIEQRFFEHYLEYFKLAEDRRRWNLWKDVPWDKCNPNASPLIADVVEAFSAVEMFLPDYTAKILQLIRKSRGRAWFQANWGYEESKHSLTLAEWLVRSRQRSAEGMPAYEKPLLDNAA